MSQRMKAYRKRITPLNKYLDTTEIKMCAKHFADIDPTKVPGRALQKYTRAFLNETLEKFPHGSVYRPRMEYDVRHPRDEDRNACAQHFREYFEKAVKINSSETVYPDELVKELTPYRALREQLDDPRYNNVRTKVRECMVEHA